LINYIFANEKEVKFMEERKTVKISLSTSLLIIAIIIILIMSIFIFLQQLQSKKEIAELENNSKNLQETIDNLQNKIDNTPHTINDNTIINEEKAIETVNTTPNVSSANTVVVKQKLNGMGYNITLYSNNEVKIMPVKEDLQTILGSEPISVSNNSYNLTGLSGEVEKMYQGNNGAGVDPITFFIMKDGTVQYIQPLSQIINNNDSIPTSFKIDGKIDNLNDVVDLKTNSNDVIIAITKDGKEIKCWNEWRESM